MLKTALRPLILALAILAIGPAGAAEDWSHYGADAGGTRYAPGREITPANVKRLTRAWTYRTGHLAMGAAAIGNAKFQATPILAEGRLALCTPFNAVVALDPGTGRQIWKFDPRIDARQHPGNGFNCRGVSYWRDPVAPRGQACAARLFMGTNDHRLFAIDLETGKPCAGFGRNGAVEVDPGMALRWPGEFQISSPPAIVGEVAVVGSAISDNARREAPRGVIRAFDLRTGALRWSFDPIPRDAATAASQGWKGPSVPVEGHANAWAPMAVDAARGLVFVPTSSPSPDFFGGMRPGDNRHANSVVALDAATGQVRWAFQTVHHDVWDYDVPAQPLLATIRKDGAPRDVVIQVAKTGLVFTLDRDTGVPVFAVQERPVPQGGAAGEQLSPTQPFPVAPAPLVPSRIKPDDAFGITPWDRGACRKAIAGLRAEGLFTPPTEQGTLVFPFTGGGANWGGAAFDPTTNRLYVNTNSALHKITLIPRAKAEGRKGGRSEGAEFAPMDGTAYAMTREVLLSPLGLPCNPPPWGELHAIDMNKGVETWRATLGTTEDLAPLGLALDFGTPNLGGPMATGGGLIFIGAAMDRYLRAFDAATGRELWQGRLPAGGQATPMSYVWKGRQYVVIAAGGHSELDTPRGDYVVAFALPGDGEPGPSLASQGIDRPGGRFKLGLTAAVALLALLAAVALRLRRRAR
jgi:quinoprotein glucose dehydrogenase